jgi:hypothetical protein
MTFQFPTGSDGYPSTAEKDLKKEGHYMKSLIALLSSGVDRVALPMTCLVQHLVRLQLLTVCCVVPLPATNSSAC